MGELNPDTPSHRGCIFRFRVILGAGVYTVIGEAAGASGNMLWLSFTIAAFTALLTLFAYAELSALFSSSGGGMTDRAPEFYDR